MKITRSDEDIWFWYEHVNACASSGLRQVDYCRENKLDCKAFANAQYRMKFKMNHKYSNYQQLLPIARKCLETGVSSRRMAKESNVDARILKDMVTHVTYLDIIERIKQSKAVSEKPMQFIQVPSVQSSESRPPMIQEHELMEKQNDIEITIATGVKVSISPSVDSMKIIKIIELLKDL